MDTKKYQEIVDRHEVKESRLKNGIIAFIVGGLMGMIGNLLVDFYSYIFVNKYSNDEAQKATARYLKLAQYLLVKYLDGNMKREKNGEFERSKTGYPVYPQFPGYPQEYYKAIVSDSKAAENLKVVEPEK